MFNTVQVKIKQVLLPYQFILGVYESGESVFEIYATRRDNAEVRKLIVWMMSTFDFEIEDERPYETRMPGHRWDNWMGLEEHPSGWIEKYPSVWNRLDVEKYQFACTLNIPGNKEQMARENPKKKAKEAEASREAYDNAYHGYFRFDPEYNFFSKDQDEGINFRIQRENEIRQKREQEEKLRKERQRQANARRAQEEARRYRAQYDFSNPFGSYGDFGGFDPGGPFGRNGPGPTTFPGSKHHQTLGVSPGASQADIKKAWRKLCIEHHPDKPGGNADKMKEINAAYAALTK